MLWTTLWEIYFPAVIQHCTNAIRINSCRIRLLLLQWGIIFYLFNLLLASHGFQCVSLFLSQILTHTCYYYAIGPFIMISQLQVCLLFTHLINYFFRTFQKCVCISNQVRLLLWSIAWVEQNGNWCGVSQSWDFIYLSLYVLDSAKLYAHETLFCKHSISIWELMSR